MLQPTNRTKSNFDSELALTTKVKELKSKQSLEKEDKELVKSVLKSMNDPFKDFKFRQPFRSDLGDVAAKDSELIQYITERPLLCIVMDTIEPEANVNGIATSTPRTPGRFQASAIDVTHIGETTDQEADQDFLMGKDSDSVSKNKSQTSLVPTAQKTNSIPFGTIFLTLTVGLGGLGLGALGLMYMQKNHPEYLPTN